MEETKKVVGLMADPGRATEIAHAIGDALAEELSRHADEAWQVEVNEQKLPLSPEGEVRLAQHTPTLLESRGWEYLIYVTDLPRFRDREPMLCEVDSRSRAALVILPALGVMRTGKRARRLSATLVGTIAYGAVGPEVGALDDTVATAESSPTEGGASIVLKGPFRYPHLLLGMVHTNRPTTMSRALTGAIAAAVTIGAFGIFYSSIWSLANALHPARLLLISILVVAAFTGWLITRNGLWNKRRDKQGPRWPARLDNVATLITVGVGVIQMYVVLCIALLVLGVAVVDADYLRKELLHPVGPGDYVKLAWLSASLGTLAGALGSNFDSADTVREATYSDRWHERRELFNEYDQDNDSEGDSSASQG